MPARPAKLSRDGASIAQICAEYPGIRFVVQVVGSDAKGVRRIYFVGRTDPRSEEKAIAHAVREATRDGVTGICLEFVDVATNKLRVRRWAGAPEQVSLPV